MPAKKKVQKKEAAVPKTLPSSPRDPVSAAEEKSDRAELAAAIATINALARLTPGSFGEESGRRMAWSYYLDGIVYMYCRSLSCIREITT